MSAEPNPIEPAEWDERDWDHLLEDVADRSIIPIVGTELLTTEVDGKAWPLYRVLAEKLAERLRLSAKPLTESRTLNDVVCGYVAADRVRNTTDRVYGRLCEVFADLAVSPPPALTKLAEIRHFQLFLTTTPDPLLEQAINSARFGGVEGTATLSFSPREADDLPRPYAQLESPTVYHLLGKLSRIPDQFVASDEDLLEFFFKLQATSNRFPNLFDALGENHLLFLGGAFSDWLARLFLRTAKRLRLSEKKSYDLLTADALASDANLVLFLRTYASKTRIEIHNPIAFVDQLHSRWMARHGALPRTATPPYIPPPSRMPNDAIFISYASENVEAVRRLKTVLDGAGFTVWFDKDQLMAGSDWEDEIERNIQRSLLFLPVISRQTDALLHNVFFRAEWNFADTIAKRSDPSSPFIIPVALDPIAVDEAFVPPSFRRKQFEHIPQGVPGPEFIARLHELVASAKARPRRGVEVAASVRKS
ncbi:MAG TPA: toll/interleukin-1 receptor domain-containing protein [Chthoniobacterales bacterium]|jgi:hypothetical protein|nr:toll/interleukin-1 receptor domain-containing protein [Chthoniobacterales bacterium]